MSKIKQGLPDEWHPDTWSSLDQEQQDESEDQREASTLLSFVVISLCIGAACCWAGILTGRI